MAANPSSPPLAITFEQLIALNDEMAALARAGVPLEKGLRQLGGDLPRSLARITDRLAQRLHEGQDLAHVLATDAGLPPAYRAVITAGVRSGRLAAALEGIASLVRRAAETRRIVGVSMIYPIFILSVAYLAFLFSLRSFFPVMIAAYREFLPHSRWLAVMDGACQTTGHWAPWLPGVVLGLLVLWWIRSQRAWRLEGATGSLWRGPAPRVVTMGDVLYAGRVATFADVLALLVEHDVPLAEAVALAADASADRRLRASGRQLADELRRGQQPGGAAAYPGMPPMLGWLLAAYANQKQLVAALRRAADSYRRAAQRTVRRLAVYLPLWLTGAIGGTAVVLYALSVFAPWCHLLYELAKP